MRIALENAGADRGLLILPQADELLIQAEAWATGDHLEVVLCEKPITEIPYPASLVRYVARTHQSVILDDASKPNLFSEDDYLRGLHAKSILCLPLIKQGQLTGLLYLENTLTTHAFTPDRIAILDLLAAQAAISLENTRLYSDLQEREAKVRRLVDANIIGIFIWDFDGHILEANDAFLQMLGYDREDLVAGRISWTDLTPPEWRDADAKLVEEQKIGWRLTPFEKEYFRKDGSRVPVLIGVATFEEGGNQGVAFVLDLTERKQAEAALRDSEQRFRDFTESASDWYWETGPDHRMITITNQPDAIGIMPAVRIGAVRWEFALDVEEEPEKWRLHMADLDAHRPFRDFRYRASGRDGSEVYIATNGKPLFDSQGRFLGYRGVASHITAAVRAALLEEALQEAKVIGDNIAHDLRTPLTRVRLRLERGREHASTLEEFRAVTDQAISGLDQSLTTITALLRITEIEHSRRHEGFSDVQLAPLLREVGDLYDPIAEDKGIIFRVEIPAGAMVQGDRDLLFEAVANLVDNAVKFTPEGGRVQLALFHQEDETVIRVSDTGPGIPELEREAVTQRFYRSDKIGTSKAWA